MKRVYIVLGYGFFALWILASVAATFAPVGPDRETFAALRTDAAAIVGLCGAIVYSIERKERKS